MEFSARLTAIAKSLLKDTNSSVEVYCHRPSSQNLHHWTVIVDLRTSNEIFIKGSAVHRAPFSAFIRALGEAGENLIVNRYNLPDRGGLAAGFFRLPTLMRAKNECLERDAFLFHYRNQIPFKIATALKGADGNQSLMLYEMASADPAVYAFLATDRQCATGVSPCLLFGLGASNDKKAAAGKAIGEYSTMLLDHRLRPSWCEHLESNPKEIKRLPDFHHVQSRDERNRLLFAKLCSIPSADLTDKHRRATSPTRGSWTIQEFESPIRFMRYLKVSNPSLLSLTFGKPEPLQSDAFSSPLYHPVW